LELVFVDVGSDVVLAFVMGVDDTDEEVEDAVERVVWLDLVFSLTLSSSSSSSSGATPHSGRNSKLEEDIGPLPPPKPGLTQEISIMPNTLLTKLSEGGGSGYVFGWFVSRKESPESLLF
jgi:hypothetical protein